MTVLAPSKNISVDTKNTEEQNEEQEDKESMNETDPLKPNPETKEVEEIKQDVKKKLTFRERFKLIKDNTTVEPIMACYVMPGALSSLAIQNFNLEKACRVNLNYSDEICDALNARQKQNYTKYEDEVQSLITSVQAWENIIATAIPLILILFVGAWSDKTGKRKACILIPIVGEVLACLCLIVNTYFFNELPVQVTALTKSIFPALTGGAYTNYIGVFSYIGDITTEENRTYRVGVLNMFMTIGYPIGSALSGVILSWVGYYGVFSISLCLYSFSLLYGYYLLEEPKRRDEEIILEEKSEAKAKIQPKKEIFREFFDYNLVLETFRVAFKRSAGNRRLRISLLLLSVIVIFGPMNGEYSIVYLFTRYRFNWDEIQFSMWSTYTIATNMFGTYFSIYLFSTYLKLDDTILGIISIGSKIAASFAYAFARNNLEIYLAPLIEMLNGTSYIAIRSISSKLVDDSDFGKLNSLFSLAEAMTPLIYSPLYTQVYDATLKTLPGAVFLLGSLLTLPAVGIFTWLYYDQKKDLLINEALDTDPEQQQVKQLKEKA